MKYMLIALVLIAGVLQAQASQPNQSSCNGRGNAPLLKKPDYSAWLPTEAKSAPTSQKPAAITRAADATPQPDRR